MSDSNTTALNSLTLNSLTLHSLTLNKGAERRLRGGHLWIYSNEVDTKQTPLKQFAAGEQVLVKSSQGKSLGIAMINPQNLICGRLINRDEKPLDTALLIQRLQSAQVLRDRCFQKPYYRLVFGESDFLSGLIVDRFGDYFSVQTNTAGMDLLKQNVVSALEQLYQPKGILLKNDSGSRTAEGLEACVEVASGAIPDLVELEENDTKFLAPLTSGQKTGWFYDHRSNRQQMQKLVKDKTVLDVFSYIGGWGVQALQAGATSLTCIDSSQQALDIAKQNAQLNNRANAFSAINGSAIDVLKNLNAENKLFDVVILDPPAFIKKAKDKKKGEEAYHYHNQLALKLLKPGGILISASCSMHLKRDELMNIVRVAGTQCHRELTAFYQGGQGADHPVHPAIGETEYLKAVFLLDR